MNIHEQLLGLQQNNKSVQDALAELNKKYIASTDMVRFLKQMNEHQKRGAEKMADELAAIIKKLHALVVHEIKNNAHYSEKEKKQKLSELSKIIPPIIQPILK